jgi:hypothetical protein
VAFLTLEQPYMRRPDGILPGRRSEVFRRFTPGKGLTGDLHRSVRNQVEKHLGPCVMSD